MATFDSHKNFVTTSVLNSPGTSGTTLTVASLTGSIFPGGQFNCVVYPAGVFPTSLNSEIVRVTTRTDDSLTIARHQESTTARNIVAGDLISMTITAKCLTDIEALANHPVWTTLIGPRSGITLSGFDNDLGNYGGFLTGITGTQVTDALGFTPAEAGAISWGNVNANISNPTGTLELNQNLGGDQYAPRLSYGINITADNVKYNAPGDGVIRITSGTWVGAEPNGGSAIYITSGGSLSDMDSSTGLGTGIGGDIVLSTGGGNLRRGYVSLITDHRLDITDVGIGIDNQAPMYALDVTGDVNLTGSLRVGTNVILDTVSASVLIGGTGSNVRIKPGTGLQWYNSTTGLWHTKTCEGSTPADGWSVGEA